MNDEIHSKLNQLYQQICPELQQLFVVPLILHQYPKTNYLYQLYRFILRDKEPPFTLKNLTLIQHYRLIFSRIPPRQSILHYHWFEFQSIAALIGICWKMACIWLFKLRGGKLIWTIHNREPHGRRFSSGNLKLRRWMARQADRLLVHCPMAVQELSGILSVPHSKFMVIRHPVFPVEKKPKKEARKKLSDQFGLRFESGQPLYLLYGNIAPYKQLLTTIKLFSRHHINGQLLIIGTVKKGDHKYARQLTSYIKENTPHSIIKKFLNDAETELLFSATDYVLINPKHVYASGVAWLAASFGVPLIAPDTGCLTDMNDIADIRLFENEEQLISLLQQCEKPGML